MSTKKYKKKVFIQCSSLPEEIWINILSYLDVDDQKAISQTCHKLYQAACHPKFESSVVYHFHTRQDFMSSLNSIVTRRRKSLNLKFSKVSSDPFGTISDEYTIAYLRRSIKSLQFIECEFTASALRSALSFCSKISELNLCGSNFPLMCGTLFDFGKTTGSQKVKDDKNVIQLLNVKQLSLANLNDLTSSLVDQFLVVCPNVCELSLQGCRLLSSSDPMFALNQSGLPSRLYKSTPPISHILGQFSLKANTITGIDLSYTVICSDELVKLLSIDGLQLTGLKLAHCRAVESCPSLSEIVCLQPELRLLDLRRVGQPGNGLDVDFLGDFSEEALLLNPTKIHDIPISSQLLNKLAEIHLSLAASPQLIRLLCELFKSGGNYKVVLYIDIVEGFLQERRRWSTDLLDNNGCLAQQAASAHKRSAPKSTTSPPHANAMTQKHVWAMYQPIKTLKCPVISGPILLDIIGQAPRLTELDLSGNAGVDDSALITIVENVPLLTVLSLAWCYRLTDRGLNGQKWAFQANKSNSNSSDGDYPAEMFETFPISRLVNLRRLFLTACSKITDTGIEGAIKFRSLCELNLTSTCCTDKGLLAVGSSNPSLRMLSLRHCQITDKGLESVAPLLRRVVSLDLYQCGLISGQGLAVLGDYCGSTLRELNVTHCSRLSDEDVDLFEDRDDVKLRKVIRNFLSATPAFALSSDGEIEAVL